MMMNAGSPTEPGKWCKKLAQDCRGDVGLQSGMRAAGQEARNTVKILA